MGAAIKRFGSIFPFMEAGAQPRQIGRLVANHDFVKSLLTYGTFDEYVFSNTSLSNLSAFADTVKTWGLADERLARIQYVGYAGLPAVLQTKPFHVFHLGGWGRLASGLHYVRGRYASNPWPITAVTHSLHSREVVEHAVRISHAGLAACDAIFCTSRDGRDALQRLLDGGAAIAGRAFAGQFEHLPLGIDDALVDATGESVASTFMVTAGMFGALALYGTMTRRSLEGLGQFLFMGLIGVVLASVVGMFWHNDGLQLVISFIGVIVLTGLAAYDAQRLKAMALAMPAGQTGSYAVVGALALYLDFINLFLLLLRFLGSRRD